jgi:hypothetical protein
VTVRLTDLLRIEVVDEDGKKLGALMDLRCRGNTLHGRPRKDALVETLVFAMPGLLEHFGIRDATSCEASWKDVLRVTRERIVIRRSRHKRAT